MVPNRVPASGKQSRGLSGQAKCPPLHSSCVWDAGRSPPHTLLTIPLQPFGPAWVTCMSSASQQPCGGVSQGRGCLCPLTAWQCQGRRGCRGAERASQPPGFRSCPPTQAPTPWGLPQRPRLGQVVQGWGTLVRLIPVAAALLSCH